MAIAIDQSSLGTNSPAGSDTTVALTTTNAVASNGFITLFIWLFDTTSGDRVVSSVAGGGLTWDIDAQGTFAGTTNQVAICSAQAPAGLAGGSTITATLGGSCQGRAIAGTSWTGVETSSAVDVAGTVQGGNPGTAWTTGSLAIEAGSLIVGISELASGSSPTSTPTAPSIELFEFNGGDGDRCTGAYRIEAVADSYAVAGTWGESANHSDIGVAYLEGEPVGGPVVAWITA